MDFRHLLVNDKRNMNFNWCLRLGYITHHTLLLLLTLLVMQSINKPP